ncbi:prepilin-type N-terminal cleavage/methylation domain-containing protein [Defluviimonas salinarum]|uniref:Prepilin-type N-terminal cleavage/methylation domain-containing protein n=1 Tax=Defluviimonas salinarum TaxID=2992147 RepID=A0ABT3J797_9RHOB|nr:prepilin-type N-terminal cleavage/methylation domain-containing protein [Defluviimonas salinarum]MCW3783539.1 prepilin-type N-terminal cleavage/methylation domain-containing protein [Defluviimonas salinarum]
MISRSESLARSDAGFTLMETLVVLAILSLILGASVATLRPGAPQLALEKRAAGVIREAASLRRQAIAEAAPRRIEVETCHGARQSVAFFPDGTAAGPDLCLAEGDRELLLMLDPMTGTLAPGEGP